jgi:predicted nucleic acid-binding protein
MAEWVESGEVIAVPDLALYEAVAVLRKYVAAAENTPEELSLTTEEAIEAGTLLYSLGLRVYSSSADLARSALRWAETLGGWYGYDAQSLALAEQLGARLWTADGKFHRAALAIGVQWVRCVEEVTT